MGKLDGKVAIVTGAGRGLGRAYARRLGALGTKVAVSDINLRSFAEYEAEATDMTADSTMAEIEATGGTAIGVESDVMDRAAVDSLVQRLIDDWGVSTLWSPTGRWARPAGGHVRQHAVPALRQLVTSVSNPRANAPGFF